MTTLSIAHASSSAGCASGSATIVAAYDLAAGTSFQAVFPAGLVLKPTGAGDYWCLLGLATIEGNPGIQYWQHLTFNGFVESGSFTPPSAPPPKVALTRSAGR
jgi:hypothetical protein